MIQPEIRSTCSQKKDYLRKLISIFFILIPCFFMVSCGGGGGNKDSGENSTDGQLDPDLKPAEIISKTSKTIDAVSGGTIEHLGASLTVPPGALDEDIELSIAATSLPSKSLKEDDGALLGKKVISTQGIVITADKDFSLNKTITLRMPLDLSQIPAETSESDIDIATDTGGYVIPQGKPSRVDLVEGFVEFELSPGYVISEEINFVFGQPIGYSVGFLVTIGFLAASGNPFTFNPLIATLDDVNVIRYSWTTSDHFVINYKPDIISLSDVLVIERELEKAYDLYVTELGFKLPNAINYDGLYSVYIDDLKKHYLLKNDANGNAPAGITLPGSSLFEGASYIHGPGSLDELKMTAAHEYFHSLQYGALSSAFTSNMTDKVFYSQSEWVFEGSAAALAARVVNGNGVTPSRDNGVVFRLREEASLYDPNQEPAPSTDVAQDFFYYLEKRLGNARFYLPTFKALGFYLADSQERGVNALANVLSQPEFGSLDIEKVWMDFIRDYYIENNSLYATTNVQNTIIVPIDGSSKEITVQLPALSYSRIWFKVPPLKKDSAQNLLPDQLSDLVIGSKLTIGRNEGTLNINFVDDLSPSAKVNVSAPAETNKPLTTNFNSFRIDSPTSRNLFAIVSNSSTNSFLQASLTLTAKLDKLPNGGCGDYEVYLGGACTNYYPQELPSQTEIDLLMSEEVICPRNKPQDSGSRLDLPLGTDYSGEYTICRYQSGEDNAPIGSQVHYDNGVRIGVEVYFTQQGDIRNYVRDTGEQGAFLAVWIDENRLPTQIMHERESDNMSLIAYLLSNGLEGYDYSLGAYGQDNSVVVSFDDKSVTAVLIYGPNKTMEKDMRFKNGVLTSCTLHDGNTILGSCL